MVIIAKRFKGMQVNGWKASSIKRYSKFKGKKPNQKYLFSAVFKKGKKEVFYSDDKVNTIGQFRENIKKDAHRFDWD